MAFMNETRIVELRRERGWTQEKLAEECGVGIRTIQRLEAGSDASLDTLSMVAEALGVPVRDLFTTIDSDDLNGRVDSLEARTERQQFQRDRTNKAWLWLFIGVGVIASFLSFAWGGQYGAVLFFGYWGGGTLIAVSLRNLFLDPHLDEKYPLSRNARVARQQKRRQAKLERKTAAPS